MEKYEGGLILCKHFSSLFFKLMNSWNQRTGFTNHLWLSVQTGRIILAKTTACELLVFRTGF